MSMQAAATNAVWALNVLANVFVFVIGLAAAALVLVFLLDRYQTRDAVLRNYPVIGHARSILSKLGEFLRQYLFAMDREELPFNRAERNWAYRAAAKEDTTVAFGSTKYLREPGTPLFVNCPYPTLEKDIEPIPPLVIGPTCRQPFEAKSFFNISAMSYGALSEPAILALSKGAKLAGCWMNTGEGGLAPQHLAGGADLVFQIGTAKYGVRNSDGTLSDDMLAEIAAHPQVRMFEIKLSQGAKPGKGGILPGVKVTPQIAAVRGIEAGKDSLSPNRHEDVNSNRDLLALIKRVRELTGKPVGIKAVVGAYGWIEDLMAEIKREGEASAPDFFTLDSADGGTGAAPLALQDNVGLTIRESLPLLSDILKRHGLAARIPIIASGKLITPADAAWALCAGARFVNSARGFMFALGCIQSLKCNRNTCPTGITTHDKRLQRGLDPADKAVKVANYCLTMQHDVETIAHSCGVPHPRRLRRFHVRIVGNDGRSTPLNDLYPTDDPADSSVVAARLDSLGPARSPETV